MGCDGTTNDVRKIKRGRPDGLPRFRSDYVRPRWKKLEADAQTKLHLTRGVDLAFQSAPIVRFANDEARVAWVEQLIVVEHVREDGRELQMVPFGDQNVLFDAQVHIPERQAAKSPGTTIVPEVDAQDRV